MATSKRKSTAKHLSVVHGATPTKAATALTLAETTVTWPDHEMPGGQRRASGRILARLLIRGAYLDGNADLMGLDVATGSGPSLLRGMGAILYPDAGSPTAEIYADQRWFLNWALDQLAAEQKADQMPADAAATFTVTVKQ